MKYWIFFVLFLGVESALASRCASDFDKREMKLGWTERSQQWPYEMRESSRTFSLEHLVKQRCTFERIIYPYWEHDRYLHFKVWSIPKGCLSYVGNETPLGKAALEMCVYASNSKLRLTGWPAAEPSR